MFLEFYWRQSVWWSICLGSEHCLQNNTTEAFMAQRPFTENKTKSLTHLAVNAPSIDITLDVNLGTGSDKLCAGCHWSRCTRACSVSHIEAGHLGRGHLLNTRWERGWGGVGLWTTRMLETAKRHTFKDLHSSVAGMTVISLQWQ